jgi:sedoheptulose-bisphosphatase
MVTYCDNSNATLTDSLPGETEWSRNGRYTGVSDISLLPEGEHKVTATASMVFGKGRLIDPTKITHIICSPRKRAKRTLELYLNKITDAEARQRLESQTDTTEDIAEWTYGDYDGLKPHEIKDLRKSRGHDKKRPWDIWRDGCEGGECPAQVTQRLDRLISKITSIQEVALKAGNCQSDIIVVAHGHILRAFVKRWLEFELSSKLELMLEPGGICGLSYAHGNVNERAVLVGMSFPEAA